MNRILSRVVFTAVLLLFAGVALAGQDGAGVPAKHEKRVTILGKHEDKRAIERLADDSDGDVEIDTGPKTIISIKGRFKIDRSKPVEDAAVEFIDRHRNAFGLKNPKEEFKLGQKEADKNGNIHLRLQQTYNGVPVWCHESLVHVNKDSEVYVIESDTIPTPDIDTTPSITAEEAIEIARADVIAKKGGTIVDPITGLCIYNNKLAYEVGFLYRSHGWRYLIDAKSGRVLYKQDVTCVD